MDKSKDLTKIQQSSIRETCFENKKNQSNYFEEEAGPIFQIPVFQFTGHSILIASLLWVTEVKEKKVK
jgi:hypothetical protein